MTINELDFSRFFDAQWKVKEILEAVKKHCDKDEDGTYTVLVGNEDYEHDRIYLSETDMDALETFLKCDW